jgi:soluble lytic murein transglycosylase-like protein
MAFCFDEAGKKYDINPRLLKAIAYTESRLDQTAVNDRNGNGTVDYGLMQINSAWLGKLEEFGVFKSHIINEPCTNVHVGAWILAQNFAHSGEGWLAVGAYNAGYSKDREAARQRYINIVKTNFERLSQ